MSLRPANGLELPKNFAEYWMSRGEGYAVVVLYGVQVAPPPGEENAVVVTDGGRVVPQPDDLPIKLESEESTQWKV